MIASACRHENTKRHGRDRNGHQRFRCKDCGLTWTEERPRPLGNMRISVDTAKLALRLLLEGNSIRSTERITGLHRDTVCRLVVYFGQACREFLDRRMRGLKLTHLEFDEQWTYVLKKQGRLTIDERRERSDIGEVYLWTCVDQKTKLMPSFAVGKRSADNARRFMLDVASRLTLPSPHASDQHAFQSGEYRTIIQISTDGFPDYPEAVDLHSGRTPSSAR